MEDNKWMPLGSVIVMKETALKLLIVGRGLSVNNNGQDFYFDYSGAPYPQGIISDRLIYFNHNAIDRVLFEGYDDDDNQIMNDRINEYIKEHPDLQRIQVDESQE